MSSCAHNHSVAPRRVLLFAVCLTLTFAAVEFFGGRLAGSLALVADAGHMLTDSMALALRSEEHTSELQSRGHLVCRLLLEKKKKCSQVCWAAGKRCCRRQKMR